MSKTGHQAPIGMRINSFNSIELNGDFAYCKSHNFVYNTEVQKHLLYVGQPCYYTDNRYEDSFHNYFKHAYLFWSRKSPISLKSCVRRTLNTRNIPRGTTVRFNKDWYDSKRKIDNGYVFKIKKENVFDPDYKVNNPAFFKNFSSCVFSKELTDALRDNGFLVRLETHNTNFLSSMVATAALYATGRYCEPGNEEGEIAIAYGHGKQVGFSSHASSFKGYSNGRENILWDNFGEFNKWSRCNEIPKTTSIDEIIKLLMEDADEED